MIEIQSDLNTVDCPDLLPKTAGNAFSTAYDAHPQKNVLTYDNEDFGIYMQQSDALTSTTGLNSKTYTFEYQYVTGPVPID